MNKKTRSLAVSGMLTAITLVLGLTPIGIIPLGFINVTIMCLPVIVGALVGGLKLGMLLGAVFGICSTLSAFGMSMVPQSGLAQMLLGVNPLYVIVMCIVPRLLVPMVAYGISKLLSGRNDKLRLGVAAVCGSLTNTFGYLGIMLICFMSAGLDSGRVLALIFGTGAIAGSLEAVCAAIVTIPVVSAVTKRTQKAG